MNIIPVIPPFFIPKIVMDIISIVSFAIVFSYLLDKVVFFIVNLKKEKEVQGEA